MAAAASPSSHNAGFFDSAGLLPFIFCFCYHALSFAIVLYILSNFLS